MFCPDEFVFHKNKCIYFSNQTVDSWYQARNECLLFDSDLHVVRSRVIVDQLNSLLVEKNLSQKYWIGAQAMDGNAFWTDRSIILSNGPWWKNQNLPNFSSNETCIYAENFVIDSLECDETGLSYVCEKDAHQENKIQIERSASECSKSLSFQNRMNIHSNPSLNDYRLLDPNFVSNGASFKSSWVRITFESHTHSFNLNEINITKTPSRAIFRIKIFVTDQIVETVSGEGFSFIVFFDLREKNTNKFELEIINIDGDFVDNVKVSLDGCLRRGPILRNNREFGISKCANPVKLSNLQRITINAYNNLNGLDTLINPNGMGCSFDNDETQIEIDLTKMPIDQIVSVILSKDANRALLYLFTYYKGEKMDVHKAYGLSQIEISGLAHNPTDKIVIIIRNINGALVQNVKISLMVCLIDYEPPTIAPVPPIPYTCSNKIELAQYSSQVQITSSTEPINSINNIYQLNSQGCSFRNNQVTIVFSLINIDMTRLYSLKILKDPYQTMVTVEAFNREISMEKINLSGRNRIEINNFGNYIADKVVVHIFQWNGNVLENVRINLVICLPNFAISTRPMTTNRRCLYEQIFSSNNPWFDLTSEPNNPQLWNIMYDRVEICNFNSNQALITVLFKYDIINHLILVRITKDPNSSLIKLTAFYRGFSVFEKNGAGTSQIELSGFPDKRIDRIEIRILNQNRFNVENVKLFIKVCTDGPDIPTIPTSTSRPTTTVSLTRPPAIICSTGSIVNFNRMRPLVRLVSSTDSTDLHNIFPDSGPQGVNLFGKNPNIVFNLLNEISTQIFSIKVINFLFLFYLFLNLKKIQKYLKINYFFIFDHFIFIIENFIQVFKF